MIQWYVIFIQCIQGLDCFHAVHGISCVNLVNAVVADDLIPFVIRTLAAMLLPFNDVWIFFIFGGEY